MVGPSAISGSAQSVANVQSVQLEVSFQAAAVRKTVEVILGQGQAALKLIESATKGQVVDVQA